MQQETCMSFNSQEPHDIYDHEKVMFIHPVINAQAHAKVGLPFFDTPCILEKSRVIYWKE